MNDLRAKIINALKEFVDENIPAEEAADAVLTVLREQEPVAWQKAMLKECEDGMCVVGWAECDQSAAKYLSRPTRALFAAPIPPAEVVVPDAMEQNPLRPDEGREDQYAHSLYVSGWNACRAAMLKHKGGE